MNVQLVEPVEAEYREIAAFLGREEAINNIPLGLLQRQRAATEHERGVSDFVVRDRGAVVLYAHYTPRYPLAISAGDARAVDALAARLRADGLALSAVHAPSAVAERFLDAWPELRARVRGLDAMGLYSVEAVSAPPAVGLMRRAARDQLELMLRWHIAFCDELDLREGDEAQMRRAVSARLAAGHYYLLVDDGTVVASAAVVRLLPTGAAIGYVYTPPELRRRGYASDLVAKLSAQLLADGRSYVCLFTQMKNETSNKIYQNVGYRWIGEFTRVDLDPPSAPAGNR